MSKKQRPRSVSEVSGHSTASCEPPEQFNAIDDSITKEMVLRRTKCLEDLNSLNLTPSLSRIACGRATFLLKCLFTSVIEDVMMQLWILERCNNELCLAKTLSDIDYLKALKYGVYDGSEAKDDLDGIDFNNLNCTIYKIKKLDADRKYVHKVMGETYFALTQSFSIEPLVSYITAIEDLDRYRANLTEEENKNKMLRKELSKQVRQQRNHIKTVIYDTEVIIDKLRTQVEDSVLYAEVGNRYIDNWQEARTEQHMETILFIEKEPSTKIESLKQKTDHELRVHTEVDTLVTISITETLAKIEQWMEKFDRDMEKIDLKIQMKKNEYQDKRDINIQHTETLEKHGKKINEWVQFKTAREAAELYHKKMLTSAIIVQAWWRGLLVRLGLGPYKVKKQRGQKKKKP